MSGAAAVSVGFARFSYALILPAMRTDLSLSYAQAGALNTANALGYLLGALLTVWLVNRTGNRRLLAWGLVLTTVAVFANGLTSQFPMLVAWRLLTGMGAAGAFICGGVLSGMLGNRAIVIYFSGGGLGLLASGAALPWLFASASPAIWPWAWMIIGALCLPLSWLAIHAGRRIPEPGAGATGGAWPWRACLPEFTAYTLFGLGYIAYMTFIIAWLSARTADPGELALASSITWSVLGVMTLAAPVLWRRLFQGRRDGLPMAATLLTLGVGAILPLYWAAQPGLWLSAALVGATVFMVPSAATAFVKTNLPPSTWGHALAVATSLFALGQTAGPLAAGWLSDRSGDLSTGLVASAMVLFAGALVALLQRPVAHTTRE